jgi:translation initiation factor 2B subunit (eIF-2B alpha/beta/delta family)
MNTNDRLNKMSKEEMISLIKEIKITCESNRRRMGSGNNIFNFILRLIKGSYERQEQN